MNIFQAFEAMWHGNAIVKDTSGTWYKNRDGKLVESFNDGKSWHETNEFEFGKFNIDWQFVRFQ